MRPSGQPPEPPFRRSTTRAIAWTALLLAALSLLVSLATFVLTWQEGRLTRNALLILDAVEKMASERAAVGARPVAPRLDLLLDCLGDVERLAAAGDANARAAADRLLDDMTRARADASEAVRGWLDDAIGGLREARERLASDAPDAARRLRALGATLGQRLQGLPGRATPAPEAAR